MFSENTGSIYVFNAAQIWQVIVIETILQLNKVFSEKSFVILMVFDFQTLWIKRTGEIVYQTFAAEFLFSDLTPSLPPFFYC